MLVRCGGNVIEIGRPQLVVVSTAALMLLVVSVYCVSLLYGSRHADLDWAQPTPIDGFLERVVRDHRRDDTKQDQAQINRDKPRRKTAPDGL